MSDIRQKGNKTCGGCGGSLAEKMIFEVTGPRVIVHGSGVCAGFSTTMLPVPKLTLHFSGGGGAGAGHRRGGAHGPGQRRSSALRGAQRGHASGSVRDSVAAGISIAD